MNDQNVDMKQMRRHVDSHPCPLIFVTISGAHLSGFPSGDSDFDLLGAHKLPLETVVGLSEGRQTVEKEGIYDGLEIDLVTHDIEKLFRLMLRRNGYVLEQIFSPLVVSETPELEELKSIAVQCITKHHAHHYMGFASAQWKLFSKEPEPRVKPLLYTFRVLQTGIQLMHTGRIEANLKVLNERARLPYIDDLLKLKREGAEKAVLREPRMEFFQREFERQMGELEEAYARSQLQETTEAKPALNDLLVRLRLGK